MTTTKPTVRYWNGAAWTDISMKVRSYSYTAGRTDEVTGSSPGLGNIVLDNADSSVVGVGTNLLPKGTPIQVRVNGNTQDRFNGWVDGSPVIFTNDEGTMSLVTIGISDSLALMQRHVCQATSIYEETLAYALKLGALSGAFTATACGYWPLSDPSGSKTGYEATGTGMWGAADFGSASPTFGLAGVTASQTTSMNSTGTGTATIAGNGSLATGAKIGGWFLSSLSSQAAMTIGTLYDATGAFRLSLSFNGANLAAVSSDNAGHSASANHTMTDSLWHYAEASMDASGNVTLFLDSLNVGTASPSGWAPTNTTAGKVTIGGVPAAFIPTQLCHVWVALRPDATSSGLNAAKTLTLGGLTTTQFLGYLAKWAVPVLPFGANTIDTQNNGTTTPSAGVTFGGNDCLTLSQVAADTEDGPLFCARSGVISSLTHDTLTDRAIAAPVAAFVNGDVEGDIALARDAQYLVTNCQITALSGSGSVQSATKNVAKFGNYPFQRSLYVSDYQALDYATWKTSLYGDINYGRIGQFTIDLLNALDIQTAALAIDIGSRVTFAGLPPQGGYTTADVIVQGFTENWTIDGWSITFNTTPSTSYVSWVLEDATYGLLDQTTILGY